MDDLVMTAAEEVRIRIEKDVVAGAMALVNFAGNHAVNRRLKHSALILQLQCREANDDGQRSKIDAELKNLLEEIVADNREHAHEPEVAEQRDALDKMYAHYRELAPENKIAFKGDGFRRQYGSTGFALGEVTFALRLGEITAVVGQNAHGKTTLLRILAGELAVDSGEISYPYLSKDESAEVDWIDVKKKIAYVPQDLPTVFGSLYDNLRFEAAVHGLRGADNDREVEYAVERLGLTDYLEQKWQELSGGYKLRFALARVLVWKPKLLIMDEPLANLDVKAQTEFLLDVQHLSRSIRYPMAVIMSSQHLHELEAISNNLIFLRRGEVVYNGAVSKIGSSRNINAYEIGTSLSLSEFKAKLEGFSYDNIEFNGVSYVIQTPLDVEKGHVLKELLARDVDVTYFRDISSSSRMMFE